MFFILNRQKIYTYLVSIVTVVLLFCVAGSLNTNNSKGNTIQTASTTQKLLPIYNVQTEQKKVAFTMNCAWNADDVDTILKTLQDNNVKITFFMVGEWIEKYPEETKKIHEAGHEIASHSDTHPHVNNLSFEKNIEEIEKSNDKIEKVTGKRSGTRQRVSYHPMESRYTGLYRINRRRDVEATRRKNQSRRHHFKS